MSVKCWVVGSVGLLFSLAGVEQAVGGIVQWAGNSHWYEAVSAGYEGITWTDARDAALSKGGYLATITTVAENDFVYDLACADGSLWFQSMGGVNEVVVGPWLGGFQPPGSHEPDGGWSWVTGETWSYTNWGWLQPNNSEGSPQDCLHFFGLGTSMDSTWNDLEDDHLWPYGSDQRLVAGYIVEWDSSADIVPEPSTLVTFVGLFGMGLIGHSWRRPRAK